MSSMWSTYWSHILCPVRVLNFERELGLGFGCTLTCTVACAGTTGVLLILRGWPGLDFDNLPMRIINTSIIVYVQLYL